MPGLAGTNPADQQSACHCAHCGRGFGYASNSAQVVTGSCLEAGAARPQERYSRLPAMSRPLSCKSRVWLIELL